MHRRRQASVPPIATDLVGLTGEEALISAFWTLVLRDVTRGRADRKAEAQDFLADPAARQVWLDLAGLDLEALASWIQATRTAGEEGS
jgi:hypothetical protein